MKQFIDLVAKMEAKLRFDCVDSDSISLYYELNETFRPFGFGRYHAWFEHDARTLHE